MTLLAAQFWRGDGVGVGSLGIDWGLQFAAQRWSWPKPALAGVLGGARVIWGLWDLLAPVKKAGAAANCGT